MVGASVAGSAASPVVSAVSVGVSGVPPVRGTTVVGSWSAGSGPGVWEAGEVWEVGEGAGPSGSLERTGAAAGVAATAGPAVVTAVVTGAGAGVGPGTAGRLMVSSPRSTRRVASSSGMPTGSPTNSTSWSASAWAVAGQRGSWPRWAAVAGLRTLSHSWSSIRGMPARTWRGRSRRPCSCGAGTTTDPEMPAHRPVRAA